MITTHFIFLRISLSDDERFVARSPRGGRPVLVHIIDVWHDGFFVSGDDSRRHNHPERRTQISWGFRKVDELPMPLSVAQEVQNCFDQLRAQNPRKAA